MAKDHEYIAKLNKSISRSTEGNPANKNPSAFGKRKKKKHIKKTHKKKKKINKKSEEKKKIKKKKFLKKKKIIKRNKKRTCPVCEKYSFHPRDDLYMNKFEACFKCYVQYVEGREKRWATGWRPDKEQ